MQDEKLLADSGSEGFIGTAASADVDAQALDFLIERGERDHEALGGPRSGSKRCAPTCRR